MDNKTDINFSTLVLSFSSLTLVNLGLIPEPTSNKHNKNLDMAQQNINILSMLEEKTKGNLTEEEQNLLGSILRELRLEYVRASSSK